MANLYEDEREILERNKEALLRGIYRNERIIVEKKKKIKNIETIIAKNIYAEIKKAILRNGLESPMKRDISIKLDEGGRPIRASCVLVLEKSGELMYHRMHESKKVSSFSIDDEDLMLRCNTETVIHILDGFLKKLLKEVSSSNHK